MRTNKHTRIVRLVKKGWRENVREMERGERGPAVIRPVNQPPLPCQITVKRN